MWKSRSDANSGVGDCVALVELTRSCTLKRSLQEDFFTSYIRQTYL